MGAWQEILEKVVRFASEHWVKALSAGTAMAATSLWGFYWARRSWLRRHDLNVLHFSLNTFQSRPTGPEGAAEPWLILDVLQEDELAEVVTHPVPRRLIKQAARKTTVTQPFLWLAETDRWYVLNILRLAIAETCRTATLAKLSAQAKVDEVPCVFAATFERYSGMRQAKLRVMIVPRTLLEDPQALHRANIRFESETHRHRLTTLRRMQEDFRSGAPKYCMDVRLSVRV